MIIHIADDEPLIAANLSHLLRLLGHRVSVSAGALSTLDHLRKETPDLLLLDWLMPEGGGQRVLLSLTQQETMPTRVVLMTGSTDENLPLWIDKYPVLHKPFRLHDLQGILLHSRPLAGPGAPAMMQR